MFEKLLKKTSHKIIQNNFVRKFRELSIMLTLLWYS